MNADCVNLKQTREMNIIKGGLFISDQFIEKISLVAFEGSSVTLVGFLKYNILGDYFSLDSLAAIVAGGT
jgi:hypothetical protein